MNPHLPVKLTTLWSILTCLELTLTTVNPTILRKEMSAAEIPDEAMSNEASESTINHQLPIIEAAPGLMATQPKNPETPAKSSSQNTLHARISKEAPQEANQTESTSDHSTTTAPNVTIENFIQKMIIPQPSTKEDSYEEQYREKENDILKFVEFYGYGRAVDLLEEKLAAQLKKEPTPEDHQHIRESVITALTDYHLYTAKTNTTPVTPRPIEEGDEGKVGTTPPSPPLKHQHSSKANGNNITTHLVSTSTQPPPHGVTTKSPPTHVTSHAPTQITTTTHHTTTQHTTPHPQLTSTTAPSKVVTTKESKNAPVKREPSVRPVSKTPTTKHAPLPPKAPPPHPPSTIKTTPRPKGPPTNKSTASPKAPATMKPKLTTKAPIKTAHTTKAPTIKTTTKAAVVKGKLTTVVTIPPTTTTTTTVTPSTTTTTTTTTTTPSTTTTTMKTTPPTSTTPSTTKTEVPTESDARSSEEILFSQLAQTESTKWIDDGPSSPHDPPIDHDALYSFEDELVYSNVTHLDIHLSSEADDDFTHDPTEYLTVDSGDVHLADVNYTTLASIEELTDSNTSTIYEIPAVTLKNETTQMISKCPTIDEFLTKAGKVWDKLVETKGIGKSFDVVVEAWVQSLQSLGSCFFSIAGEIYDFFVGLFKAANDSSSSTGLIIGNTTSR